MITLYGTAKSRASRSIVALEGLGIRYEHVPLVPVPGSSDRELLERINPNGHIPVLDDDGLIVWESMAINLYLGDRHRGPLWPSDPADRALVYQWSFWTQT
jgi:glutathione S-transferase